MTDIRLDNGPLEGRHYETGTLHNAWALRGARAPHTGQPYSEALLLGVSGGITFGYFTFAYTGELPHLALLTRNTFDPFDTILERLAPAREVRQTADAATAERQLNAALEAGEAPVVWADVYSLPYYGLEPSSPRSVWMMRPMVVVGRSEGGYLLADGARQPWWVSAADLAKARGRVKRDRFRLMTLEPPKPEKLPAAVAAGLAQCSQLFTEAPPKGAQDNFGFAAYDKWAAMLVDTKHRQSWPRLFPRGPALFQALGGSLRHPGLLGWVMTWTTAEDADRRLFADFLDEAALILNQPGLREAGGRLVAAADAWHTLALAALPEGVPLLAEARQLHLRRHALFVEAGQSAAEERAAVRERLEQIRKMMEMEFPMSEGEVTALRAKLSEIVLAISQIEREAVQRMKGED
jgi:Butirosin biosynthesis protein H, N-terminal